MVKNSDVHNCELCPDPDKYVPNLPPNPTCWQKYKEKWRHITTVSTNNPYTNDFFKSRAAIRKERIRQYKYPYAIHPLSRLSMGRDIVMFFVWSINFIIDPLYGTFLMTDFVMGRRYVVHQVIDNFQVLLSCAIFADIIFNFFVGYKITQTHEVVLDPHKIARRYVKTYFFFDVIAMINSLLPFELNGLPHRTSVLIHQLFIFRLARVQSQSECFVFMLRTARVPESIAQCTNIVLSTIYILNWLTCLLAWVPLMGYVYDWPQMDKSWTVEGDVTLKDGVSLPKRYMKFLLITMCHFYGASSGFYRTNNVFEFMAFSLIIMIGIGYYTYAVAVVCHLFRTDNISETMYMELVAQVNQYGSSKKLTQPLKNRLLQYYEAKFQRKFFNEHKILHSLSEHLRYEVILYSCKHLIENVYMFKGLPKAAIGTLIALLKQEIYLPGDVVTSSETPILSLHFISYGTLALLLTPRGQSILPLEIDKEFEVMHMEDGDTCGNTHGLWVRKILSFRTVALERTELYTVSKQKFEYCMQRFPELAEKATEIRENRQNYILKFAEMRACTKHEDILQMLNHGKILLVGRKR